MSEKDDNNTSSQEKVGEEEFEIVWNGQKTDPPLLSDDCKLKSTLNPKLWERVSSLEVK